MLGGRNAEHLRLSREADVDQVERQPGTEPAEVSRRVSSVREATPSLRYARDRWNSTVRALRNTARPTSALVRPWVTSRAICSSWEVS